MPQYLTIKDFGGWAQGYPVNLVKENQFIQVYEMRGYPTLDAATNWGFLSTLPAISNYKATMPAVGRSRGLHFHRHANNDSFLLVFQCTTDYSVGKLYLFDIVNNDWTTPLTNETPYWMDFTSLYYNGTMRTYFCNSTGMAKWSYDFTTSVAPMAKNKGGTATAIATAVLTWNVTATVTSSIDISASISKGDWIRKSSTSTYWDEVKSVAVNGLTITLIKASSDTGASAAGGAQKAPEMSTTVLPTFLKWWKNKLWFIASNLRDLYWSVTGDPEDISSSGSGNMEVTDGSWEQAVGLGILDDYLFIFKDYSYDVYQWTGDLDEPITFVKKFNYGCVSHRTIQDIGGALIYYTGPDLRMTNGNQDVSLLEGTGKEYLFRSSVWYRASTYFSSTATDNNYPWAVYDEIEGIYILSITGTIYYYDVKRKFFLGTIAAATQNKGAMVQVYSTTALPVLVYSTALGATNQLKQISRSVLATASGQWLMSKIYNFGSANKKKKIYWVEFEFHALVGCNTNIKFSYWDGGEIIESLGYYDQFGLGRPSQVLAYSGSYGNNIQKLRYLVNAELRQFGWMLNSEANVGATDGYTLVSVTICYDAVDNP